MKRVIALFILCAAAACLHGQTPQAGTHTGINLTFTPPGVPCTTTTTKACIQGYTETLTPPTGVTGGVVTVPFCATSTSTNCIGAPATAYLWKPGGNLYCGTWNISLVANWIDDTGTAKASLPATTTVTESCPFVAGPPTKPTATLQ